MRGFGLKTTRQNRKKTKIGRLDKRRRRRSFFLLKAAELCKIIRIICWIRDCLSDWTATMIQYSIFLCTLNTIFFRRLNQSQATHLERKWFDVNSMYRFRLSSAFTLCLKKSVDVDHLCHKTNIQSLFFYY